MVEGLSPTGILHRSVSQFGTFAKCGEQYRLEKVVKAPQTPAAWFFQGTAFHAAIEFWERSGRQASWAEVEAVYEAEWGAAEHAARERCPDVSQWMTGGRKNPEADLHDRRIRGREQVRAYMDWAPGQDWQVLDLGDGEYAVELDFELQLGNVLIRGFIDQVVIYPDGGLMVRDLKTGTKLPDWPFQLGVYDVALHSMIGQRAGWGDFYMAKNTALTLPYNLDRFTPSYLEGLFAKMDIAEKAEVYLPNPGDGCRTCGVKPYCSAVGQTPGDYLQFPTRLE